MAAGVALKEDGKDGTVKDSNVVSTAPTAALTLRKHRLGRDLVVSVSQ